MHPYMVDIISAGVLVLYVAYLFTKMKKEDKSKPFTFLLHQLKEEFNDPWSIIYMIVYLAAFYIIVYFLDIPRINGKYPLSIRLFEAKSWGFMLILLLVQGYKFASRVIH